MNIRTHSDKGSGQITVGFLLGKQRSQDQQVMTANTTLSSHLSTACKVIARRIVGGG